MNKIYAFLIVFFLTSTDVNIHAKRHDSEIPVTVVEVDPSQYNGEVFQTTGSDGSVYNLPLFRNGPDTIRSNDFSWSDETGIHQGYISSHRGEISIVEISTGQSIHNSTNSGASGKSGSQNNIFEVSGTPDGNNFNSLLAPTVSAIQAKMIGYDPLSSILAQNNEYKRDQQNRINKCNAGMHRIQVASYNCLALHAHSYTFDNYKIAIADQDISLIQAICNDNSRYEQHDLFQYLASDPRFNEMESLFPILQPHSYLQSDIFVNQNHFDLVPDSQSRKENYKYYTKKWEDEKQKVEDIEKSKQAKKPSKNKKEVVAKKPQSVSLETSLENIKKGFEKTITEKVDNKKGDYDYAQIMHDRSVAFNNLSHEQALTTEQFSLKSTTVDFMKAHDIDRVIFDTVTGNQINNQITKEMISVFDKLTELSLHNLDNETVTQSVQLTAQVSQLAQYENSIHNTSKAISAANCSHGLLHYVQGLGLQGYQRCEQMIHALSYFNEELGRYIISAGKGVAKGVVANELASVALGAMTNVASACAPGLTATISAGLSASIIPIVMTAGAISSTVLIGELANLGYLYTTDQIEKFNQECTAIANFASRFYDFNQTKYEHVENIAQGSTTIIWPWKKQAILNSLMGIQTVQANLYCNSQKVLQRTQLATQNQVHDIVQYLKDSEFAQFTIHYKKILKDHVFNFIPKENPGLVVAGLDQIISSSENLAVSNVLATQQASGAEKITQSIAASTLSQSGEIINQNVQDISLEIIDGLSYLQRVEMLEDQLIKLTETDPEKIKTLKAAFAKNCRSDLILPGLENIHGVSQIEYYRNLTEEFKNIDMLEPHEILYLNMCQGFYVHALKINEKVKNLNLFITEADGTKTAIIEFDIFHSLLGELKHVSSSNPSKRSMDTATKGGHWLYVNAKVATHITESFVPLDQNYFDLSVKHIKNIGDSKPKTFFPYGMTPDECVESVIEAIQYTMNNPTLLKVEDSKKIDKKVFNVAPIQF